MMKWDYHLTEAKLKGFLRQITRAAHRTGEGIELGTWLNFSAPRLAPRRILYITKPEALMGFDLGEHTALERISVFGRYGLVTQAYASLVASEAIRSGLDIYFVGDLDPWDLVVFLTLVVEVRKHNVNVHYLGIRDDWLELCRREGGPVVQEGHHLITLKSFELGILNRLCRLPVPWEEIIGSAAFDLLRGGSKLELEGATNPRLYSRLHHRKVWEILKGS